MSWPATMPDKTTAIYANNTSLPPGLGVQLGNVYILASQPGKWFKLVQASGTIPANAACAPAGLNIVKATTAINQPVIGCNESGSSISTGQCFWMSFGYNCSVLAAASIASGSFVASSATGGTVYAATPGTDQQGNAYTLAASGSGGATAAYLSGAS